jgi:putative peptidoglycan lipid II flippase
VLGYLCALPLPPLLGIAQKWGVAGLTVSAGIAGWVEFAMLRFALNQRVGWTGLSRSYLAKLWSLALGAAVIAFALKLQMTGFGPRIQGLTVLSVYGGLYFAGAWIIGIPEFAQFTDQIRRRFFPRPSANSPNSSDQ